MSKKVVKNVAAVLIFAVLFFIVDIGELLSALSNLTPGILAFLLFLSVVLIYISALKWKLFLEGFGSQASVSRLFRLYLIGYFINQLLPSYVGGDLTRSYYVGQQVGQHNALAATILERFTGFVAMVFLALISLCFVDVVPFEITVVVIVLGVAMAVVSYLAVHPGFAARCQRLLPDHPSVAKTFSHIERLQESFRVAARNPGVLTGSLALSFLFHSITVVNTLAAAYAVGWYSPPWIDVFTVLPLILLVGALPITPSGFGLQEGAFFFFLQAIGASPAEALGIGIVLRAKSVLLGIVGGLVWVAIKREQPPEVSACSS